MFDSCYLIKKGPEIKLASIGSGDYICQRMFANCISLTKAPSLKNIPCSRNYTFDMMFVN